MKTHSCIRMFYCILLFSSSTFLFGQQTSQDAFSQLFLTISEDTTAVSIRNFAVFSTKDDQTSFHWNGSHIPNKIVKEFNLDCVDCAALGKISLDPANKFIAYLIGTEQSKIYVLVYAVEQDTFIFQQELAHYERLETAFEKIRNTWIVDLNKDGLLEFAIWEKQLDFEFSNDLAKNQSKEERFVYSLFDNKFTYKEWPLALLKEVLLSK